MVRPQGVGVGDGVGDMRVCSLEAEIGYVRVAYIGVEKWDNWSVKRSVPF